MDGIGSYTDVARIGRFEQSDPVHARCDQPKFSFDQMIGIEFGRCQSFSMDQINLGLELDFGTVEITIEDQPYELSIAAATIAFEKENAEILFGTKYKKILKTGKIDSALNASERVNSSYAGSLDGGIAENFLPSVKAKGSTSKSLAKEAEIKLAVEYEIALVEPAGQDKWKIGGPDGHPLKATRDLRGSLIEPFDDDRATPLCSLSAIDSSKAVVGRVRVQVSATDFRLRPKQQPFIGGVTPRAAHGSIRDGLKADQVGFAKRAATADISLKQRIAALALVNPVRKAVNDPLLDIAERSVVIEALPAIEEKG